MRRGLSGCRKGLKTVPLAQALLSLKRAKAMYVHVVCWHHPCEIGEGINEINWDTFSCEFLFLQNSIFRVFRTKNLVTGRFGNIQIRHHQKFGKFKFGINRIRQH